MQSTTVTDVVPQSVIRSRYVTFELVAGCDGCAVQLHQMYFELCEEPVLTVPPTVYRKHKYG